MVRGELGGSGGGDGGASAVKLPVKSRWTSIREPSTTISVCTAVWMLKSLVIWAAPAVRLP